MPGNAFPAHTPRKSETSYSCLHLTFLIFILNKVPLDPNYTPRRGERTRTDIDYNNIENSNLKKAGLVAEAQTKLRKTAFRVV